MSSLRISLAFVLLGIMPFPREGSAQMQDIDAELWWGSKQKAPAGSYLTKIVAAGEWGAYLLRYRPARGFGREQAWLEVYDERYGLSARHELNAAREGNALEDVIALRGRLYVLTSRTAGDAAQLWLRPLSTRAQVTGTERLLAEMDADDKFRRRQFDLKFSGDSTRILIYNQLPSGKETPERFTLRVFDDDFQLQWSRDVTLPYRDKGFSIRSYEVDAAGDVYLHGRQRPLDGDKRVPPLDVIYAYRDTGREEVAYQLQIDGIYFNNLRFAPAANGELACAGFYSTEEVAGSVGICHLRIDPNTRQARSVHLLPFPTEFLVSNEANDRDRPENTLHRYQLRDLTLRSDGGIVLVAEQFYRQVRRVTGPVRYADETMYDHYNDVIVANVAPDGTYTWLRRIPKRQQTPNNNGLISSFAQATVRDRFIFLYNEHPDNFRPEPQRRRVMDGRDAVLAATEIQRAGGVNTIPLYVNGDASVTVHPRRCRQIGSRLVLMYGEDGREYRLGLLKIQ